MALLFYGTNIHKDSVSTNIFENIFLAEEKPGTNPGSTLNTQTLNVYQNNK
jgi:hypothetical protein